MTEPSDWAPVLVIIALLAVRRCRPWYLLLVAAGLALADSPTCVLVMAVTVPLYYALCGRTRHRVALAAALIILVPLGTWFTATADSRAMLASGNSAEIAAGRLVAGVRDVTSGGAGGAASNMRYASTAGAVGALEAAGRLRGGLGPDADAVYFPAITPPGGQPAAWVNAIWVYALADFGYAGVVVVAAGVVAAAWRVRRCPAAATVFLPMLAASLVNSAIPDWWFAGLAVMLFALWRERGASPGLRLAPGRRLGADLGPRAV